VEIDLDELERLREIESLVQDLFALETDVGGMLLRSISPDDERDEVEIERRLKELVGLPASTEPELQHQRHCLHPSEPCNCRRSHLLSEARRLATMIPSRPSSTSP
jgi:hypothetical protein